MKLVLVGDVMPGRWVNEELQAKAPAYPWSDTLPVFHAADLRTANLECVISDRGTPWCRTPKVFHFRSDAKNAAMLQCARIDAVSVANNHALDFEVEAMFDMLDLLDGVAIGHAGAGANFAEASRMAVSRVKGERVGVIACTDNEPEWAATDRQPGIFYVPLLMSRIGAPSASLRLSQKPQTRSNCCSSQPTGVQTGDTSHQLVIGALPKL